MRTAFVLALCTALAAGPALAQPPAPPAAPVTPAPATDAAGVYQVYRTTDSQLSCEQIISELSRFAGKHFDPLVVETLKLLHSTGMLKDLYPTTNSENAEQSNQEVA